MATTRLDRRRVARVALDLLNETGLDGLTLRAIAKELDVKAPALYWHFKDKQALLDEMATEMVRGAAADLAGTPDADWQTSVTTAMRALRRMLLHYRDGAKVYSGTYFTDTSYAAPVEAQLRRLTEAGFTTGAAARALMTAMSYTIGYVIEEQASGPRPGAAGAEGAAGAAGADGEGYDLVARAERLKDYPLAAAAGEEMFRGYEDGFEAGLAAVVAGVGVTLLGPGARPV
ncbi:TetR/AcrR family transcriptional regulator C-terminal domain-containing protein [Streptomyces alboflavus]|uniref:TetR/AcrR family transcriptional regulator C-terminal domain-containing protein n=1 Tax=Streptomyces alboflavus TaxID=67267 RepID=UPI0004C1118F|nr:TetR/AcrR family transcriptional regulator C-terminal domain-containing protein [Streptomyces alboflavus]